MGYVGGKLAPLFEPDLAARASRRMADKGGERMTANVRERTPVDHGALRASIEQKLLVVFKDERGDTVYESGAETSLEYAPHIEHGTGLWGPRAARYEIRPKRPDGWLRWIDSNTGKPVFAKRVLHPGSSGASMFADGVAVTEHEFESFAGPILDRWARETEANWLRKAYQ